MSGAKAFLRANSKTVALTLILLLGAVLRLTGLDYGLPTENEFRLSPVDAEVKMFDMTRAIHWLDLDLDPDIFKTHHGEFPAFTIYAYSIYLNALNGLGLIYYGPSIDWYRNEPGQLRRLWLACRLTCVLFALGTIYLVFILGSRLLGPKVGLWAALLLAVLPGHVLESHYWKLHIPNAFFVTLVCLLAIPLMREGRRGDYIKFTIACGVLMSIQYIGVIVGFVGVLAGASRENRFTFTGIIKETFSKRMVLVYLGTLAIFLALNPFYYKGFLSTETASFAGRTSVLLYDKFYLAPSSTGFWYCFTYLFPYSWSPPLALLGISGIFYAMIFVKNRRLLILLVAFLLVFIVPLNTVFFNRKMSRHALGLAPFMTIITAYIWCYLPHPDRFTKFLPQLRIPEKLGKILLGLAAVIALLQDSGHLSQMLRPTVGDITTKWMVENLKPGSKVGTIRDYREIYPIATKPGYSVGGAPLFDVKDEIRYEMTIMLRQDVDVLVAPRMELLGRKDKHIRMPQRYPIEYAFAKELFGDNAYQTRLTVYKRVGIADWFFQNIHQPRDFLLLNFETFLFIRNTALTDPKQLKHNNEINVLDKDDLKWGN